MKRIGRRVLYAVLLLAAAIALVEGVARIVHGAPSGRFEGWFPGDGGLYPPSARLRMPGPIPYVAATNALGFRGAEWAPRKLPGTIRIAALGDSITDGFFVENENGYPARLEEALLASGHRVEVLNAAHGGGSIDKEFAILRERVADHEPDVVVLTFVTNDLFEIDGRSRDELVSRRVLPPTLRERLLRFTLTRTSAGEWLWERYLVSGSETYGRSREREGLPPDQRYRIDGGDRFRENAELFLRRFARRDARLLGQPLDAEIARLADAYLFTLAALHEFCRGRGIELVVAYFPSYPEIYLENASQPVRDLLREASGTRLIPFLDLTEPFRGAGVSRVLHLAPLDFHPNPDGNRLIAESVAAFLESEVLSASGELEPLAHSVDHHQDLPGSGGVRPVAHDAGP